MVYGVWCMERRGEICALKRAEGRGGGLCHAAGDMRAYGAREGVAGMYSAGDSAGYGGYGAGDSGEI